MLGYSTCRCFKFKKVTICAKVELATVLPIALKRKCSLSTNSHRFLSHLVLMTIIHIMERYIAGISGTVC